MAWRGTIETAALAALAAAALLATAPAAGAQTATVTRAATAAPTAAQARAQLEQLRRELAEAERRQQAFASTLGERPVTQPTLDSLVRLTRQVEQLRSDLRRGTRQAQMTEDRRRFRALELQARERAASTAPQGWFGVDVRTTSAAMVADDGQLRLSSSDYPLVVSVEPGSPAARAGLLAGDRLVSIVGRDLRETGVDMRQLLRPGAQVPVRLLRDGELRDVLVAVTARPTSFGPGEIRVSVVESPTARTLVRGAASAPRAPAAPPDVPTRVFVRPTPSAGAVPAVAPSPTTWLFTSDDAAVAGAQLLRLSDGLRAALGVERGVFVSEVRPGLAARAGIRPGDVLVRADTVLLASPADFVRVVQRAGVGDRTVRIELVRERKARVVEMKW